MSEKYTICRFERYGREPVIRRMPNGNLMVTFLTGGIKEPSNDNFVAYSISKDDGKTWSEPAELFNHPDRAVWCAEISTFSGKPVCHISTYNAETHYRELQPYISYSENEGLIWSHPISPKGGLNGCSFRQGIEMSNGEILFPIYWQEDTGGMFENGYNWGKWPFRCGVAITDKSYRLFRRYGYIANDRGLWENNCVELEPGHILMLMRNNGEGYLARSDSYDFGRTWSEPINSGIPNPRTKLSLAKVNGKILLANNFSEGINWEERRQLELRISDDNLRSYCKVIPLEPTNELWFYPHIYVDYSSKKIYVTHENSTEHRISIFTFDELEIN